jgi:hypothetical protein
MISGGLAISTAGSIQFAAVNQHNVLEGISVQMFYGP